MDSSMHVSQPGMMTSFRRLLCAFTIQDTSLQRPVELSPSSRGRAFCPRQSRQTRAFEKPVRFWACSLQQHGLGKCVVGKPLPKNPCLRTFIIRIPRALLVAPECEVTSPHSEGRLIRSVLLGRFAGPWTLLLTACSVGLRGGHVHCTGCHQFHPFLHARGGF